MPSALILVDIQNDFFPGGSLVVPEGDRILPKVKQLVNCFATVITTQDWHPAGHISFASRHAKKPFTLVKVGESIQQVWPDHCVQNTTGAELHPQVNMAKIAHQVLKGQNRELDSYSAFFDNERVSRTDLEEYLIARGIDTLYVAGLATDICVHHTCMDALELGFTVVLVKDASAGIDSKNIERIYALIEEHPRGRVMTTSEVCSHIQEGR